MKFIAELDALNRITLGPKVRAAAGIKPRQRFSVSVEPGSIVLTVDDISPGCIAKRGRLKVWTGPVPSIPIGAAIRKLRGGRI